MTTGTDPDCLFCRIVARELPATIRAENELAIAFDDVNPQAPTHVLVVPRRHEPDIGSLSAADPESAVAVLDLAREVADTVGGSYHLLFNTGAEHLQSVFHAHGHVISGRTLGWGPA